MFKMRKWVAAFNINDDPMGDEMRIAIEGTEVGFVAEPEYGDEMEFDIDPAFTEEEALYNLDEYFQGWDTYHHLSR
jgi:hypothetical protein